MKHVKIFFAYIIGGTRWMRDVVGLFWKLGWWSKLLLVLCASVIFLLVTAYGISRWYAVSVSDQPRQLGTTYVSDYARSLDLNAEETLDAILTDLGVERLRLVSYWNKIEPEQGRYDFTDLDWQFEKAEAAGADISLAIGLRQPRWPECHAPKWVELSDPSKWEPRLYEYLTAVVNRYKNSPSLVSYQLENEYFLEAFGECPEPSRDRLQAEFDLLKRLDPETPVIMSRSNNHPVIMTHDPLPDQVGMSVYRRVWDGTYTKRYLTYPLPAWYYGSLAGMQKILTGRDSMLHEMQMEPWPANGQFIAEASLAEQDKTFKSQDFDSRIRYAKGTGLRTIDLWGAEWWYWRMTEKNDPEFWNAAKRAFNE
jgi:hypothetical protein